MCPGWPSYLWTRVPSSEGVIGQRATHQVAMKQLLWVIATHGLLVSGRYIRERRESGNETAVDPIFALFSETAEEPRIQGKFASTCCLYVISCKMIHVYSWLFVLIAILLPGRNAFFTIVDKYPTAEKIVLKKEVTVSFNCSSTRPWWVTF